MKNKMLLTLVVLVLVASTAVFGACKAAPVEEEPIKIGGLFEMTGFLVSLGTESYQAVTVALEEVDYQVAGRRIEFIAEDTASDVAVCMDKLRKIVETDKVHVVFGTVFTGSNYAIVPYVDKMGVPNINVTAHPEDCVLAGDWDWQIMGTGPQMTYAMGLYAYEELGYRTATTIATDYEAGYAYMSGFTQGFTDSGGKIIQQQWYPFGTADFSPYIIKAGDADVLATWMVGDALIPSLRQFKELGVWEKMPIIGASCAGLLDPRILQEAGDAVEGYITESHYTHVIDAPGNKEFVEAYEERWDLLPGNYAGSSYAAMQILLEALRISGGDASPQALASALDSVSIDTIRGHISFNEARLGQTSAYIIRIDREGGINIPRVIAQYGVSSKLVGDKLVFSSVRQ